MGRGQRTQQVVADVGAVLQHVVEQALVRADSACRRHFTMSRNKNNGELLKDGTELRGQAAGSWSGH